MQLQKAVQKFNYKPEHGIKHLLAIGYMKEKKYFFIYHKTISPKDVARFFRENANISKDKIGEYFGSEHDFN